MKRIALLKKRGSWYAKFYYEDWTTDFETIAMYGKDTIQLPFKDWVPEHEVLQKVNMQFPTDDVFIHLNEQKLSEQKKAIADVFLNKAEMYAKAKLKTRVDDPSKVRDTDLKTLAKAEFEFVQVYKQFKSLRADSGNSLQN